MDSVSNPVRREVSSEVSVLVRKLGKYLGGVDVEKVMSLMGEDNEEKHAIYVMRELKLDHMPPIEQRLSDADRLRNMLGYVDREIARYQSLIADAKAMGIPQSSIPEQLKQLYRLRRRLRRLIREFTTASQGTSSTPRDPSHQASPPGHA
jgi:hypothetical protein